MIVSFLAAGLLTVGALFFLAGTVGMLRFPDTHTRLHALTKADTLGLGFTVAGLGLLSGSLPTALKLLVIWGIALSASSTVCYLVAQYARGQGQEGFGRENGETGR